MPGPRNVCTRSLLIFDHWAWFRMMIPSKSSSTRAIVTRVSFEPICLKAAGKYGTTRNPGFASAIHAKLITSQNCGILFAAHRHGAKLAATTKINGTLFCGVGSYATLFYLPCFLPACVRSPSLLVGANPGCSQHQ